jgi:hypothetical protein
MGVRKYEVIPPGMDAWGNSLDGRQTAKDWGEPDYTGLEGFFNGERGDDAFTFRLPPAKAIVFETIEIKPVDSGEFDIDAA